MAFQFKILEPETLEAVGVPMAVESCTTLKLSVNVEPLVPVKRLKRCYPSRSLGVYENVAAPFCMPLRCTAFDCYSEVVRTP
jgi:hypothetical protein